MKRSLLFTLLVSFLSLLVLSACGATTSTTSTTPTTPTTNHNTMPGMHMGTATSQAGSDMMTDSLKGLSGKDFEIRFMQEMIVHHQSAIDMAKLVPTQTKRAELITLSQNITTAQTTEINNMTNWLAQWYNEKPLTDSMSVPGMAGMMSGMNMLQNDKDAAFDQQFLTMMMAHHQQAVNMANLIPGKTQRPELVKLGQDIIRTQSAEIQQMQTWQKDWPKS